MATELTPEQESAFAACGEAMVELGFNLNISVTKSFLDENQPFFCVTAKVPGTDDEYVSKSGASLDEAARRFVERANEIIANPPPKVLRDAAAVKEAVAGMVDEYRNSDDGKPFGPLLDELADRVAALPVKG